MSKGTGRVSRQVIKKDGLSVSNVLITPKTNNETTSQTSEELDIQALYENICYEDDDQEETTINEDTVFTELNSEDMRRMDIAKDYLAGDFDGKTVRCECCRDDPYNCSDAECSARKVCHCYIQEDMDDVYLDEWRPKSEKCLCCKGFTYACSKLKPACVNRCDCVASGEVINI